MFNSGFRNRRATDGQGVIATQNQYLQKTTPIPTITGWSISGSDDTALDPAGGQTVLVNGTGFATGVSATLGGSQIGAVTLVNSNQISFTSPANSGGSYTLIVYNTNSYAAILVPGLTYSTVPTWTTAAGTIGSFYETTAVSTAVVATSDSAMTYALSSGSLPVGSTLYANGVITGTAPVDSGSTTYTFAVTATDAELQDTTRTFTMTINVDVVTWVTPSSGATISLDGSAYSQALSATDAAGYAVSYTANTLPTGLTLSAGTISGTPTTEGNTSSLLTATAATTNRSATNTVTWVVSLSDSYFKYVTLGMSANASIETSSFVADNSLNNAQLTVFGDTRAQNFNPYQVGYYSYYFTGSSYLYLSNQIALGSGDWTIEFWFYTPNSSSATGQNIYEGRPNATNGAYPTIYTQSGTIRYYTQSADRITSGTITPNTWYHIAVVKSSGTTKMWLNGVQAGSNYTDGNTYLSGTTRPLIASYDGSQGMYTGYISNLRVSNIAVYTNTFTPSTTPLLATVNTSWLTGQSNRIVDASINNFTTTISGTVSVSAANPFATVYQASTQYYSGSFNGSSDYLTLATSPTLGLGTGDFTIEYWCYPNSISGTPTLIDFRSSAGDTVISDYLSSGAPVIYINSSNAATSSRALSAGAWAHVAYTRSGTTLRIFVNGVQTASVTNSYNMGSSQPLRIANNIAGSAYFNGYISNLRVVKGLAVYTGNFVPPTAPLSTTQSAGTNIAAITQPSYSVYFSGSGQYLSTATGITALDLTSSDFTVECWVYNTGAGAERYLFSQRGASSGWEFRINATNLCQFFYTGGSSLTSTGTISGNTWTHLAVSRSGTTVRIFINGALDSSATFANGTSAAASYGLYIGYSTSGGGYMSGYISNVRITKGQALYTSTFTPSTSALTTTSQGATAANVSLLTCQSTTIIDNSLNLFAITNTGTAKVASPNPFATGTVSLLTVQSPTFVDSSYNSLAITAATTTVKPLAQSPFTPVYYSNYFGSSSDYLTVPSNAVYAFGTGDFTIEAWVYLTTYNASFGSQIFGGHNYGVGADMFFVINTTGKLFLQIGNSGVGAITSTSSVSLNTWTHVAIVRSSGTVTPYINGTSAGGAASYTTSVASTLNPGIGSSTNGNSAMSLRGYISNLRVVKGQALYTTTFTPSTTPLTLTSQGATAGNVSLLTCQSPYFIDVSNNSFAIAILGSPRIAGIAPFTQPGGYSATAVTTYGSGYFDGTGDYLTIPASANLSFGTGNFTIEAWAYPTSTGSYRRIFSQYTGAGATQVFLRQNNDNALMFYVISASSVIATITSSSLLVLNTWNHCAISRNGSSFTLYLNGISVGTASSASSLPDTSALTTYISTYDGTNEPWLGYLSDLRVIKGTALYTSAFVPSFTTPLSAVTNTQFLSLQTRGAHNNSDFVDQSSFNNVVTRNGNTTNGTFDPYGNNFSTYFNGSTYFSLSNGGTLYGAIAGSLITIEFWVMTTAIQAITAFNTGIFGQAPAAAQNGRYAVQLYGTSTTSTQTVNFYYTTGTGSASSCTTTGTISQNTWNHIAVTIDATTAATSTVKIYINGTGQTFTNQNLSTHTADPGNTFQLGAANDSNQSLTGYLSNFRFTRGQLVYTGNFTPPTAPLTALQASGTNTAAITNGSYVKALMMQSNRFNDNSAYNYSPTIATGTPQVQKFSPFATVTVPTYYSGYFDGTGDYLNTPSNAAFAFGTGDYTAECWIYLSVLGTYRRIWWFSDDNDNTNVNASNQIQFGGASQTAITGSTLSANTWYHVAYVRSSGSGKLYLNGTQVGSTTANSYNSSTRSFYIGATSAAADPWYGYISNLRVTKGQALYTTAFTPATSPLTTTSQSATASNVSLLTCQSNTIIDNSTNYFTVTATGDAKPLAVSPFTPTASSAVSYTPTSFSGSMYFDGTGDYLVGPASNTNLYPGAGDFTIDFWNYLPANPTTGYYTVFGYGSATPNLLMFYTAATSKIEIFNNATVKLNPSWPAAGQWNHFALVRSGTTLSIYINGVFSQSTTEASNFVGTLYIGADFNGARNILGYISDFRIVKGTALYTANFYPGATPATPTATIGTSTYSSVLLLSGASGGVIDYSRTVDLETVADAKVTPFSPYAGSYYSMYGATGAGAVIAQTTATNLGSTSFTVECWIYVTGVGATAGGIITKRASDGALTGSWALYLNTSYAVLFGGVGWGSTFTTTQTVSLNTWTHVAVTRSSTTLSIFLNGVRTSVAATTDSSNYTCSQYTFLKLWGNVSGTYPSGGAMTDGFVGYLSNLRIVVGSAVYDPNVGGITVPTSPLTAIANTTLLTCQSNKFLDNSSNALTVTPYSTSQVATQNPFALNSGISYYFDGTGDYLSIPTSKQIELGSADWTFETWVFPVGVSSQQSILYLNANSSGYAAFNLQIQSGALNLWMSSTGSAWSLQQNTIGTITAGVWTYIAVTKSSTTMKVYINGTQAGTNYTVAQSLMTTYTLNQIGVYNTSSYLLNGNLSDLRLTQGYVRYSSNFTPPTAPYKTN